jgi:spoIIIJ-associated protein
MSNDTNTNGKISQESIEESIQYAKKYLEDLLSFFGLNTDIYATTEDGEVIELHVPSTHLNGFLIGQRGDTMRALQFMVGTALKNNGHEPSRVNVDIADYKKARADRLAEQAEEWVAGVQSSGRSRELHPMNAADRRIVHKVANEAGLLTESVGEGYERRVVLKPAPSSDKPKKVKKQTETTQTEET